jgi:Carbohydrate-selective porin, OprB family
MTVFVSDRVRLSFVSSFTGKDKLEVRLQARNTPALQDVTGTQMTNLGFDGDDNNEVEVDELEYGFTLGIAVLGKREVQF